MSNICVYIKSEKHRKILDDFKEKNNIQTDTCALKLMFEKHQDLQKQYNTLFKKIQVLTMLK